MGGVVFGGGGREEGRKGGREERKKHTYTKINTDILPPFPPPLPDLS